MADYTFVGAGHIYRAPADTAFPSHPESYEGYGAALVAAGFEDVATIFSDGLNFTPSRTKKEEKDWAGNTIRVIYSDHAEEFTFTLVDWMSETAQKAAYGANNVTKTAKGTKTVFNSNAAEDSAWCVLMTDGDNFTEIQVPVGTVTAGATAFKSDATAKIPVTLNAIKGTGEDTVTIYTEQA